MVSPAIQFGTQVVSSYCDVLHVRHSPVLDRSVIRHRRPHCIAVQAPLPRVAKLRVAVYIVDVAKTAFVHQPMVVPAKLHKVVEAGLDADSPGCFRGNIVWHVVGAIHSKFEGFPGQGALLGR